MFALVDCNTFYASCERAFDPSLEGRPLVILSGPTGCIVCASTEAKALGARVGEPWFIAKEHPGMSGSAARQANFEFYGDMSSRVMQSLSRHGLAMEIYSIDEAFLAIPEDWDAARREAWALQAKLDCLGCGIPVSIGIGSTKTRAKLASARAKPAAGGRGVFDIEELAQRDPFGLEKLLASRPCSDIWGVGPRTAHKLAERGAITALDLALADLPEMKKLGTITLERVAAELRGEPRHALCDNPEPAQSLSRTRTFDHALTTHRELSAALAGFAEVACAQLRATGALAAKAEIFIGTHPMDKRSASRFASAPLELSSPSNDSLLVCSLAAAALRSIYKPGFNYRRAGIAFSGLSADAEFGARSVQTETLGPAELILAEPGAFAPPARVLPIEPPKGSRRGRLMSVVDGINSKHGAGSIGSAAAAPARAKKEASRLACPTTRLSDIPVAKA